MGNNTGKGYSDAAKVMKINGEFFKVKTPAKVIDIIKDYPDHILLDSQEFLMFNLRAKPLELEDMLKPRKIYLLFSLPKFPEDQNTINCSSMGKSSLRRVQSGVSKTTAIPRELKLTKRSFSDLSIRAKSTVVGNSRGADDHVVGPTPTRVKMRLPKSQVERIMEESRDDDEVAKRIVQLAVEKGGDAVVRVEEDEGGCGEGSDNVIVEEEEGVVVHGVSSLHASEEQLLEYKKLIDICYV